MFILFLLLKHIILYELRRPKSNFGCYLTLKILSEKQRIWLLQDGSYDFWQVTYSVPSIFCLRFAYARTFWTAPFDSWKLTTKIIINYPYWINHIKELINTGLNVVLLLGFSEMSIQILQSLSWYSNSIPWLTQDNLSFLDIIELQDIKDLRSKLKLNWIHLKSLVSFNCPSTRRSTFFSTNVIWNMIRSLLTLNKSVMTQMLVGPVTKVRYFINILSWIVCMHT